MRKLSLITLTIIVLCTTAWVVFAGRTSPPAGVTADLLPAGHLTARWQANIGGLAVYGSDKRTSSLALSDAGLTSHDGTEVIDSRTGVTRWTSSFKGSWLTAQGALATTPDGIGFLTRPSTGYPVGQPALAAISLVDGHTVWQSDDLGEGTTTGPLTGTALIAVSPTYPGLVVFDAHSGAVRWHWSMPQGCDTPVVGEGQTQVVIQCGASVTALQLADGSPAWSWQASVGCSVQHIAIADAVVGIVEACGSAVRLVALDTHTGGVRFQRAVKANAANDQVPGLATPFVYADDMFLVLQYDSELDLFDLSGRTTTLFKSCYDTGFCFTRIGHTVTFTVQDSSSGVSAVAVDLDSMRVRRQYATPVPLSGTDGSLMYGLGKLPDPLIMPVLDIVDPESGRSVMNIVPEVGAQLVSADSNRLYATFGQYLRSGYLGEFDLGGSQQRFFGSGQTAGVWPSACALLTPDELRAIAGRSAYTPTVVPSRSAGVPMPSGIDCQYAPDRVTEPQVDVSVLWVSANAAAARALATQYVAGHYGLKTLKTGDLTFLDDRSASYGQIDTRAIVVVGACLVQISAPGSADLAAALAPTVAKSMAAPITRCSIP